MPDTAGNSLATATALNLNATVQSFNDLVTPAANDYYRFVLSVRSSLNLSLTGLDANANVELLDSTGNPLSVGGVLVNSTNPGTFSELINRPLDPGVYFIRVAPGNAVPLANYSLNIAAQDNLLSNDLFWRNDPEAQTGIWVLDGTSYVSALSLPSRPSNWSVEALGDFNQDGNTDIVWRDRTAALTDIWFMNGTASLSSASIFPTLGSEWIVGGTGDFNRDSFIDLVWRNQATGATDVWFMTGTASLSSASIGVPVGPEWVIGAIGDFNQDGNVDLLWRYREASATGFWLLDSQYQIANNASFAFSPDPNWVLGGASDYNRDGNLDLVWRNLDNGGVGLWLLERTAFSASVSLPAVGVPWEVTAPYTRYGDPLPIDIAGNSPETAFDLGKNVGGTSVFREFVGGLDTDDFYQFSIATDARVNLALTGLTADLDFGLFDSQGNLVNFSSQVGTTNEAIASFLTAGTYFIRVVPFGATDLSSYSLGITVNTPPVLVTNSPLTVSEQGTVNLSNTILRVTDADNLPSELIYSLGGLPVNGALLINGLTASLGATFTQADIDSGNQIRYLHNGSETLSDRFTFSVTDNGGGAIGLTTFTINVTPVNDAPVVATNLGVTVSEGAAAVISQSQLTTTDPEGEPLIVYTLDGLPTSGILQRGSQTLSVGQTFTQAEIDTNQLVYSHNGSETTTDSFRFLVVDAGGAISTPGTFSITVLPVNDAPVLTLPTGTPAIDQNANALLPGIRVTDVDLGTGEVTVTLTAGNGVLNLGRTTGITFLPGSGTPGQTLAFRGTQEVTNFVLQSLIYRSNSTFVGTDTVNVTVSDGGNTGLGGPLSATGTLTLAIAGINEAPVLTVPNAQSLREDTTTSIPGISVADADAGNQPVRVSLIVTNGTLSLASIANLNLVTGTGTGDQNLVFTGTLSEVNQALSGLSYRGNLNFSGTDQLLVSVSDSLNGENGIPLSDTRAIALTVTPVNDAPVITVPGAQTVNENTTLSINGIQVEDVDATGDLTVNLSASSGRLTLNATAGLTFDGTGTTGDLLTFRGTQEAINTALRTLLYRANSDFNGTDTIAINVSDGGGTGFGGVLSDSEAIAINVLGINNAPIITTPTGALAIDSDTNLTINGLSVSDADAGGGTLSVTLRAENGTLSLSNTTGLTFTQGDGLLDSRLSFTGSLGAINAALNGLIYRSFPGFTNAFDRVTVSVNDNGNTGIGVNLSDTEVVLVNVGGAVNQVPVAVNDVFSVAEEGTLNGSGILANDLDPDFTIPLTAVLVAGPTNAANFTLNPNGSFIYSPTANFSGSDTFTYRAVDALGGSSNTAIVVINVTGENDPPIAVNDLFITLEDQTLTSQSVLANDTDLDNTLPLSAQLIAGPTNATSFTLNPDGTFSYTPRPDFSGSDRFTYVVVDGLGLASNTATVSISITAANDVPLARNDGPFTLPAGGTLNVTGAGVLANDTDVDTPLANLSATLVSQAANGTVSLSSTGAFTYQPTGSFSGTDTFVYQVSDGSLTSNLATVTLSVGTNSAPIANPNGFTLAEDGTLSGTSILANDTDLENNLPLTATLGTAPGNALAFTLNSDGTFTYQPRVDFTGVDSFTYQAIDSLGAISGLGTVTLSVSAVNDAPVAFNDTLSVSPGATLNAPAPGILTNDTDVDSTVLSAVLVATAANGTLSLNPNGSFTYRPNAGFVGTDSFTYQASDGSLSSANTATVSLVVTTAANTLPIAAPDEFTTSEDTSLTVGNVLTNDTDPDGNIPLTATLVTGPANALSFSLRPDGTFDYLPRLNFNGVDTFTYQAIDSVGGLSNPTTVTFSVTAVNDAPTAVTDNYTVATTASLDITAPGILANDTDVDGTALSATLVATAANGTLSLNPNGAFTYTPNAGFNGVDSFTYQASDGSLTSNLGTVNLTVASVVNTAPVALGETFNAIEDTPLTIGNVLNNASNLNVTRISTSSSGGQGLTTANLFNSYYRSDLSGDGRYAVFSTDAQGLVPTDTNARLDIFLRDRQTNTTTLISTATGGAAPNGDSYSPAISEDGRFIAFYSSASDINAQGLPYAGLPSVYVYEVQTGITRRIASGTIGAPGNLINTRSPSISSDGRYIAYDSGDSITSGTLGLGRVNVYDQQTGLSTEVAVGVSPQISNDGRFVAYQSEFTVGLGSSVFLLDRQSANTTTFTSASPTFGVGDLSPDGRYLLFNSYSSTLVSGDTNNSSDVFIFDRQSGQTSLVSVDSNGVQGNADSFTATVSDDGRFVSFHSLATNLVPGDTNGVRDVFVRDRLTGRTIRVSETGDGASFESRISGNGRFVSFASDATNLIPGDTNNSRDIFVASINSSVLANDSDLDANLPLTASLASGPANALSFTLNPDGSFVYQPIANFNGVDTFVYRAIDSLGATSNSATVTISVAAVNDAPISDNNNYNVAPAGTLNITLPGVLANDTDPDGNALTATLVGAAPTNALSFTFNPDGSFLYIPQAAFAGTDSFTYQAGDGTTVSNLATVSIVVTSNLFPTANPDSFTTQEDTVLTVGNVLTNDTDPDGNTPLTASVITAPANAQSFTLNPDGTFSYLPRLNFSGVDTFVYQASDRLGGLSNPTTVTFTVTPGNDLPLVTNDSVTVNAGTISTITAPGVLANDTDPDGNALTASLATGATRGTVTLNGDGSFVYTPNAGVLGLDSFTYVASDGTGISTPATVTVRVNAIPVASNDTNYTAAIGSPLNIGLLQGVLGNDTDPDGGSLTAVLVNGPTQGSLTLNANGSFVYTANGTASGTDSFVYRATDGFASSTATVAIALRTNTAPVALNDSYRAAANNPLNVIATNSILNNDTDADAGTVLSATLVTGPTSGSLTLNPNGTFTYVPNAGFLGVDSFVYRASDGVTVSGPATVTLSVSNNTPPVANNDTYAAFSGIPFSQLAPGVRGNDTDANGDTLTAILVAQPANGTVTLGPDGSFIYTANGTFQGTDTFTYRAFDGIASSTATVSLSVTLNRPPTAQPDLLGAIAGETLVVNSPGVLTNDSDPEGTLLALGGGTQPANGQLLAFRNDGSFVYLPQAGFTGVDFFTYLASDGVSSIPTTVTISVSPNAAPVANGDTYSVNPTNQLVIARSLGVLANDTDPNVGQVLSATVVTNPTQGVLSLNPDGSFNYTPNAGAAGTDSFTYRATDGSFNSTAGVTITIRTSSTPPIAQNDGGFLVPTNGSLGVTAAGVLANDSDPDGDLLRSSLVTNAGNGTVTLNPDGSFVYRPNTGFQGTDSFTYRATDGLTASTNAATVFLTVGGANAAPVIATPGGQLIPQNTTLTLASGLTVSDPDAGSSPVVVTLTATNGTLTPGSLTGLTAVTGVGTGTVSFTGAIAAVNAALTNLQFVPTTDFTGAAQITLSVNDQGATGTGGAQTGTAIVSVGVASSATLVSDIQPGPLSSTPTNLTSVGNTVYFAATDGAGGTELWSSDGTTANTRRVADIDVGAGGSSPNNFTAVGNTLFYTATTPATGLELWRTDLTTGTGSTLVGDIRSGNLASNPQNLTSYANTLFFVATDGVGGVRQLWRVNSGGTPEKVSTTLSNVGNLAIAGPSLFFTANGGTQLWKVDSATTAPVLVSNLGGTAAISNLRAVGNRLYFTARDAGGVELWSSGGTAATTARVTDLNPGSGDANPSNLTVFNGNLYFIAKDSPTGAFKLFSTAPGSSTIAEVGALPSGGNTPGQLTVVGDRLYLVADAGTLASPNLQLLSTNGTAAPTVVRDLNTTGNDDISELTNFNGSLFLVANDGTGYKVFRSDGTSANTVPVSGNFTSAPTELAIVGGRLVFAASTATNGNELWQVG